MKAYQFIMFVLIFAGMSILTMHLASFEYAVIVEISFFGMWIIDKLTTDINSIRQQIKDKQNN